MCIITGRDVQHNISFGVYDNNRQGGLNYHSVGEVNPIITMDKNQFTNNCEKLYGNFSTCQASVYLDIQNTQTLFFRVSFFIFAITTLNCTKWCVCLSQQIENCN